MEYLQKKKTGRTFETQLRSIISWIELQWVGVNAVKLDSKNVSLIEKGIVERGFWLPS